MHLDGLEAAFDAAKLTPLERVRLHATCRAIPDDARTALEIGFNDFRITDVLRNELDLVSIDLPSEIRNTDGRRLVFSDIGALPFADGVFDLVLCTEVLEHLSDEILAKGVRELQRVSRRYILVTVPYKQRVWNEIFRCSECDYIGNRMGHLRLMDEKRLDELFEEPATHSELIAEIAGYAPDWLYRIGRSLGDVYGDYQFGLCPSCGKTDKEVAPNPLGYLLQRVIWRLESAAPTKAAWILNLYGPKDSPGAVELLARPRVLAPNGARARRSRPRAKTLPRE